MSESKEQVYLSSEVSNTHFLSRMADMRWLTGENIYMNMPNCYFKTND
jgi:hypothetical protein